MGILREKLRILFQLKDGESKFKKPSKKTGYLIVIALAGLLLLILGNAFSSSPKETIVNNDLNSNTDKAAEETISDEASSTADVDELETSYEKDLQEMLEKIQGVSEVEVMVNLDSTNVKVNEKNLITGQQTTDEEDINGGKQKEEHTTDENNAIINRQSNKDEKEQKYKKKENNEETILEKTKKQKVRGIFVLTKEVEHTTVKKWMVEATARVLDVPTHRVSVMPKN